MSSLLELWYDCCTFGSNSESLLSIYLIKGKEWSSEKFGKMLIHTLTEGQIKKMDNTLITCAVNKIRQYLRFTVAGAG